VDVDGVLTGGVNNAEFQSYKIANFASNRHGYFHYTLLPHRYNTDSGSSGQAEFPGDDMIVSLYCARSDQNVANTIMHELGHNLNLHHGGATGLNWKPNYNSVMNYKYQFAGVDGNCSPPGDGILDYSRGTRITLDENDLDETQGICGSPGWDWNGDGDAVDMGFAWDINVDGVITDNRFDILTDHDDWAAVFFGGLFDGDGAPVLAKQIISCTLPAPTETR